MKKQQITAPTLTEQEFKTLIALSRKVLWSDLKIRQKMQEQKVNIVPANFYSDIPLVKDIENSFEYQNYNLEIYNHHIFN